MFLPYFYFCLLLLSCCVLIGCMNFITILFGILKYKANIFDTFIIKTVIVIMLACVNLLLNNIYSYNGMTNLLVIMQFEQL
jgi:hypothetical protein